MKSEMQSVKKFSLLTQFCQCSTAYLFLAIVSIELDSTTFLRKLSRKTLLSLCRKFTERPIQESSIQELHFQS